MSLTPLPEFTKALVSQCQADNRRIVAWSQYEKKVLLAAVPELTEAIENYYVDAKRLARRWKASFHSEVRFPRGPRGGAHKLKAYFGLIGYHLRSSFGQQQAGQRIDFVRQQLIRKGRYSDITPTAKGKWTVLLDYNWHDCYGLRELAVTVASDLAMLSQVRDRAA